jgi:hypothetical protein
MITPHAARKYARHPNVPVSVKITLSKLSPRIMKNISANRSVTDAIESRRCVGLVKARTEEYKTRGQPKGPRQRTVFNVQWKEESGDVSNQRDEDELNDQSEAPQ